MMVNMLKSEIDCATVTGAAPDYAGSITIDSELMKAAGILPGEKVQIINISNGDRLETYTLVGEANSGILCLNGAVAQWAQPGDKVKILAYCLLEVEEARSFRPVIVLMADKNSWTIEPCY